MGGPAGDFRSMPALSTTQSFEEISIMAASTLPESSADRRALTDINTVFESDGFVYLIRVIGTNKVKVGWSRNPFDRVAQLRTACHDELCVQAWLIGSRGLEARLHSLFGELKIRGEWFDDKDGVIRLFFDMAATENKHAYNLLADDNLPRNVSFQGGEVGTFEARRSHFEGALKLCEDAISSMLERQGKYKRMLDFLNQHDGDITFGEALNRQTAKTS
jgi:hypothetical protein